MEDVEKNRKLQSAALQWLYEMEFLNSPALTSNLYENVFLSDERIKDCEIFLTREQKGVLIWVKLGFFTRFFKNQEQVFLKVRQVIKTLLPSYRVRIVEDRKILEMAIEKARKMYGKVDTNNDSSDVDANAETGQSKS